MLSCALPDPLRAGPPPVRGPGLVEVRLTALTPSANGALWNTICSLGECARAWRTLGPLASRWVAQALSEKQCRQNKERRTETYCKEERVVVERLAHSSLAARCCHSSATLMFASAS
ncbi:unnamed protein product [Gadus morhua 'NCC']